MRLLRKLALFVAIVAAAPLIAGLYGALHNQVSFTVSPEYFTKFKFIQFQLLDSPLPERLRASIVGFRASWWLGPWLGVFLGFAVLLHRNPNRMWHACLSSYALMLTTTALVGLAALLFGIVSTHNLDLASYSNWYVPEGLAHPRRFICAGYMHNGSYLGAAVAIVVVWGHNVFRFMEARADGPSAA